MTFYLYTHFFLSKKDTFALVGAYLNIEHAIERKEEIQESPIGNFLNYSILNRPLQKGLIIPYGEMVYFAEERKLRLWKESKEKKRPSTYTHFVR